MERYANNVVTTLNGSITDSSTSLVVASATGAPSEGDFRLVIGSEIIICCLVSGTTFGALVRGAEGTVAAAHEDGATVSIVVTAGSLAALPWAGGFCLYPFKAPVDSDFAWVNQGSASVTQLTGGLFLNAPAGSGNSVRLRKRAAPSTPYVITAAFIPLVGSEQYHNFGLAWRQSSDGKLACCMVQFSTAAGGLVVRSNKYTNPTTNSAAYAARAIAPWGPVIWLRIADDGSNRICSYSFDGQNFAAVHTVTRTDFLTGNEVGWFVESNHATAAAGATLLSWQET